MNRAALKRKLSYSILDPLRYRLDLRHARTAARRPTRVLIASDNQVLTSEQQFAPLLANRRLIADTLGIAFDHRLLTSVLSHPPRPDAYDAIFAKLSFRTPAPHAQAQIARLRQLFPAPVALLYFDGDDDACIQWGELFPHVDLYVKKHTFADLTCYQRQFTGKNNLTDYVAHRTGRSFTNDIIPHSGTVPCDQIHKLATAWNIALDDKITTLWRTTKPAPPADKTIDIICRAHCDPALWIYPLRGPISQALQALTATHSVLLPNTRVDQTTYLDEMRRARLCISPFGYGEICWRDFEAILMGCLLIKPDMTHIRTEPDLFIPNQTYIPIHWDFSDLAETCERLLADPATIERITSNAYAILDSYLRTDAFMPTLTTLLTRAAVCTPGDPS